MAKRMYFTLSKDLIYEEKFVEFKFYNGFAVSQKQKSIDSLHEAILDSDSNANILEVSSKSKNELGIKLSAFNLKLKIKGKLISVENIFQSSKIFEHGGPYKDLLYVTPIEAKKDERIRNSGDIIGFEFNNKNYPIEPKTLFYDWIYCNTLNLQPEIVKELTQYNTFTVIEFNHEKSINCQARTVAIFVSLYKNNLLNEALSSIDKFLDIVYKNKKTALFEQLSFKF